MPPRRPLAVVAGPVLSLSQPRAMAPEPPPPFYGLKPSRRRRQHMKRRRHTALRGGETEAVSLAHRIYGTEHRTHRTSRFGFSHLCTNANFCRGFPLELAPGRRTVSCIFYKWRLVLNGAERPLDDTSYKIVAHSRTTRRYQGHAARGTRHAARTPRDRRVRSMLGGRAQWHAVRASVCTT